MIYRLANMSDLPSLKKMFSQIINHMDDTGIAIWDDIYPVTFFEKDIANNQLFIAEKEEVMVAAFALWQEDEYEVHWHNGTALYLGRFGVNVAYLKQGVGSLTLDYAKKIAQEKGIDYLRLYVVDINQPAINLYLKNGFTKVDGVKTETFDDGFELHEYGFEFELSKGDYLDET